MEYRRSASTSRNSATRSNPCRLELRSIQTRGSVGQDDEFIELHNPTANPVSLGGWSLQYKSATGTTFTVSALPAAKIPAGGYFLVARPPGDYTGATTPDATYSNFLMSASGGNLFLSATVDPLSGCTDAQIVDKVGYGTGNCPETLAVTAHSVGASLERRPGNLDPDCGNGVDTDDNAADWLSLSTPDPQNSASTEFSCNDLGDVGISLFPASAPEAGFVWGAALGASTYKIRRGTGADFMTVEPIPSDVNLLASVAVTEHSDATLPAARQIFFYFVNASNGAGDESAD